MSRMLAASNPFRANSLKAALRMAACVSMARCCLRRFLLGAPASPLGTDCRFCVFAAMRLFVLTKGRTLCTLRSCRPARQPASPRLEPDVVGTLESEHLPRFLGGGRFQRQQGQDLADQADLLGVRRGQFAASDKEGILQSHPNTRAIERA